MRDPDKIYVSDYVERIQQALLVRYRIKFRKKVIRSIIMYALRNAAVAIGYNHEVYIRGRVSIYLTKDLMIKRGKWPKKEIGQTQQPIPPDQ